MHSPFFFSVSDNLEIISEVNSGNPSELIGYLIFLDEVDLLSEEEVVVEEEEVELVGSGVALPFDFFDFFFFLEEEEEVEVLPSSLEDLFDFEDELEPPVDCC